MRDGSSSTFVDCGWIVVHEALRLRSGLTPKRIAYGAVGGAWFVVH
jgi:hypothetical protein